MLAVKVKNGGDGDVEDGSHHENNKDGEDLYNYDEPSDGEIEDDDDDGHNNNNTNGQEDFGDSGTASKPPQPGHVIELKAAIDTDDEFHDNDHRQEGVENGREQGEEEEEEEEEGESPRTPPPLPAKEHSSSPKAKRERQDSDVDDAPKKSKHRHHSSSKKDKSNRSSKSSSVSSSSRRSPKAETTTTTTTGENPKPKICLPKKYQEDQWKSSGKNGDGFTKDSSVEKRKKRSSSSADSDSSSYDDEYFKRMASRSKDPFQDPTDKELFIENLWKHIKGSELALCAHKSSTDCLIWLVESVRDNAILRKVTEGFAPDRLSADRLKDESISSVLETLIESLIRVLIEEEEKEFDTSTARWCIKYLDGLAKIVEDGIVELLSDISGCRMVIVVMEAIGGIRIGRHWSRQNMRFGSGVKINLQAEIEKDISFRELPSPFKHHLKRFAKSLVLELPEEDILDLLFGRATQVAQYLLFILKVRYPELCQMVVKKLVEIVFDRRIEHREMITQSASSAYIVEIIMMVASETRLSKIWTKYLKGSLENLWRHDIANFIVQRLIDAIKDEHLFTDVCDEIFPSLEEIFKCNRAGIGVCLAKACQDFTSMQNEFINALFKAYHCYEPKEKQLDLVPSMLFIEMKFPPPRQHFNGGPNYRNNNSYHYNNNSNNNSSNNNSSFGDNGNASKLQIWLHGSLMLQYTMSFADTNKVCKSLMSLSTDDLVKIAKDRSGSHVIDAFIHGTNVPLKYKSDLVERFLGRYHSLSLDKFGSRIVENIISLSDDDVKNAIMGELSRHESQLSSNRNGWFVAKKVGLQTFKNRPDDWRAAEQSRERKRRIFGEFVGGSATGGGGSGLGAGGMPQLRPMNNSNRGGGLGGGGRSFNGFNNHNNHHYMKRGRFQHNYNHQ